MTTLNEDLHPFAFVISEAAGQRSRENGKVKSGQNVLAAGTVLALAAGTAVAAANAGNTGNGAMGAITVTAPAKAGVYRLTITAPATNAGSFIVEDPDGVEIGTGNVGSAFSAGGLAFTLADGATDFVAGDGFTITVTAAATQIAWASGDPVVGILGYKVDATSADIAAPYLARDAEVNVNTLTFPASTDAEVTAGLARLGIIAR